MRHLVGSGVEAGKQIKIRRYFRCGGVSAWRDVRMDAGGRRGGRGAGVEGSGVKLCEGQWPRGETEPNMLLSLFLQS